LTRRKAGADSEFRTDLQYKLKTTKVTAKRIAVGDSSPKKELEHTI
jgi:hypothetical protein